jgi:hypothetical protein
MPAALPGQDIREAAGVDDAPLEQDLPDRTAHRR